MQVTQLTFALTLLTNFCIH